MGKTAWGFEGPRQVIGQSKSHEVYDQILCFTGIKDQAALLIPVIFWIILPRYKWQRFNLIMTDWLHIFLSAALRAKEVWDEKLENSLTVGEIHYNVNGKW